MPKQETEAKLQELDKRLQEGWNNLHSINESRLEAVRNVVREQWAEQQKQAGAKKDRAASKGPKKDVSKEQGKTRRGKDHDEGHSH
jgi:hypothetical protein